MIIDNSFPMANNSCLFSFENIVSEVGTLSAHLAVPDSYPFLQGHFPDNPILPAVCIIDACLELLRHQKPQLSKTKINLKRCRFSSPLAPNESVLILGTEYSDNQWKFIWQKVESQLNVAQLHVHF